MSVNLTFKKGSVCQKGVFVTFTGPPSCSRHSRSSSSWNLAHRHCTHAGPQNFRLLARSWLLRYLEGQGLQM